MKIFFGLLLIFGGFGFYNFTAKPDSTNDHKPTTLAGQQYGCVLLIITLVLVGAGIYVLAS